MHPSRPTHKRVTQIFFFARQNLIRRDLIRITLLHLNAYGAKPRSAEFSPGQLAQSPLIQHRDKAYQVLDQAVGCSPSLIPGTETIWVLLPEFRWQ